MFKITYDLLKEIHIARGRFSKSEKYSLGESLEQAALDMLIAIVEAGKQKRDWKHASIERALLQQEKAKILVRLAYDLNQIQERRYIQLQEQLQSIGRMLGGWKKSL